MSQNPFQIMKALVQHTPMIHFLEDQQGATLRGSELKPKLDKYLIQKVGGWDQVPNSWKKEVPRRKESDELGFRALDYKVRIWVDPSTKLEVPINPVKNRRGKWDAKFPAFFANMGKERKEDLRFFTMYQKVNLEITSLNTSLIKTLDLALPHFFAWTNFGTRQSKGFGSFSIENDFPSTALRYHFDVPFKGNSEITRQRHLFESIDLFYRSLRSGINLLNKGGENVFYFKSLLFLYALKERKEQWDKRTIKEHFWSGESTIQRNKHHPRTDDPLGAPLKSAQPLLRDLLGLSTEQEWKSREYRDTLRKESIDKDNSDPSTPLFARFKSPILFKPIMIAANKIFRVYFDVPPNIKQAFKEGDGNIANEAHFLGKGFNISFRNNYRPEMPLTTPKTFDFDQFFQYALKVDIDNHVELVFQGHPNFDTLSDIFNQLRDQV